MQGKKTLWPFAFHCTGMPIQAAADALRRELAAEANPEGSNDGVVVDAPGAGAGAQPPQCISSLGGSAQLLRSHVVIKNNHFIISNHERAVANMPGAGTNNAGGLVDAPGGGAGATVARGASACALGLGVYASRFTV